MRVRVVGTISIIGGSYASACARGRSCPCWAHVAPAAGAFYVYVDLGSYGVTDSIALCNKLLDDEGVAITPGVDFEFEAPIGLRRVRISYCGATPAVTEAMTRLTRWWKAGKYRL